MTADFDVIVVGSGPAGVSAAFPLVEAGLRVILVDAGGDRPMEPPAGSYLRNRAEDDGQWSWMVGKEFEALRDAQAVSPKFRIPGHRYVFAGFEVANRIEAEGFTAVGSLARGGLSNAWGCGVAKFSAAELAGYPFRADDIEPSYRAVALRMGLSGAAADDLAGYFGLDDYAGPPLPLDDLHAGVLCRYQRSKAAIAALGFGLGRSRVAALSQDRGERRACDLSGSCLWGCHRRALYCATEDLELLRRHSNFSYRTGFIVERVTRAGDTPGIQGRDASGHHTLTARRIVLAAGILATTRLALAAADLRQPVTMQACPTGAFMLWLPAALGRAHSAGFGLGQLSFSLALANGVGGFGSFFGTTGIPMAEFARYMPLRRRPAIDVVRNLLSSCLVGNLFLPGYLTQATLSLGPDDALRVRGAYRSEVAPLMQEAQRRLRKVFRKMGAWLLPRSFTVGAPGSDIHYAASLPMRHEPGPGQTNAMGELAGLERVHIVDGACLSSLPEKSHTLTIMANADRIGRRLADRIAAERHR